jgi:hypothetical protein
MHELTSTGGRRDLLRRQPRAAALDGRHGRRTSSGSICRATATPFPGKASASCPTTGKRIGAPLDPAALELHAAAARHQRQRHGADGRDRSRSPESHLELLHPNGGEIWATGTTRNFEWSSTCFTARCGIDMSRSGPNGPGRRCSRAHPTTGFEAYTVRPSDVGYVYARVVALPFLGAASTRATPRSRSSTRHLPNRSPTPGASTSCRRAPHPPRATTRTAVRSTAARAAMAGTSRRSPRSATCCQMIAGTRSCRS